MLKLAFLLFSLCLSVLCQDLAYNSNDYPNPRAGGYKECKMRSVSNVCDPEEVLTESERYRLNNDLQRLGSRTENIGGTFCQKKGVDAVLAIMHRGSQKLAEQLNSKWNVDGQCKKAVIFVLSADEKKLYFTGEENTGITDDEFTGMIAAQEEYLKEGRYTTAISTILKELGKKKEEENAAKHPTAPPKTPTRGDRPGSASSCGILVAGFITIVLAL